MLGRLAVRTLGKYARFGERVAAVLAGNRYRNRHPATHPQACPIAEDEGPPLSETLVAICSAEIAVREPARCRLTHGGTAGDAFGACPSLVARRRPTPSRPNPEKCL